MKLQKIAALLADDSIAVWESVEEDLWEETAEEVGVMGAAGPELPASASRFEVPGELCLMMGYAVTHELK